MNTRRGRSTQQSQQQKEETVEENNSKQATNARRSSRTPLKETKPTQSQQSSKQSQQSSKQAEQSSKQAQQSSKQAQQSSKQAQQSSKQAQQSSKQTEQSQQKSSQQPETKTKTKNGEAKTENKPLFDLEELKNFRQKMHQNAEIGFEEVITQKSIREYLLKKGIPKTAITVSAKTGLIVDLVGQAEEQGNKRTIACRADIDALLMTEENQHLQYKSKTKAAHMCGHDGHTTCLLGAATLFWENIKNIPKNKTLRLLVQPSEEGPVSGADQMIQEGCLDGVDEVYGFHNWPTHPVGYCLVKPGPMMSEINKINIKIFGKGGHGSEPQNAVDPVQIGVDFHVQLREMQEKYKGRQYVMSLTQFNVGERYNVIAGSGTIEGSLRSFEEGLGLEIKKEIETILEGLKEKYEYQWEVEWKTLAPILNNTEKEALHVERVAKKFFGEEKAGKFHLPVKASEDFAFFTKVVPGAFFFLGSGRDFNDTMLHNPRFDFNENLIEPASRFWVELINDRLELNQNQEPEQTKIEIEDTKATIETKEANQDNQTTQTNQANETNETNETTETNKVNETNQTNQANENAGESANEKPKVEQEGNDKIEEEPAQ